MTRPRDWLLGVLALLAGAAGSAWGGPPAGKDRPLDESALAARVDEVISARWAAAGVRPAPPAADAEFLRRAHLDLAGRIPTVAEARRFLADPDPDKRRRLVERLLDGPGYVNHATNLWRDLLLPDTADGRMRRESLRPGLEAWLRRQFHDNVGYDDFVRQVVAMPLGRAGGEVTPVAFYLARDGRPEELAAATARLFLGIRLECAQCHNHPLARWKREQFWGLAAFFAGLRRTGSSPGAAPREVNDRELPIPGTDRLVTATFLDGTPPPGPDRRGARAALADWITGPANPYFARAAVNRLWAGLFGLGLVEPVDDFLNDNALSHPELLDELARQFVLHGYDIKYVLRALTRTKAYQLSSAGPEPPDPRLFSRMAVKGLAPEQLHDSVLTATGYRPPEHDNRGGDRPGGVREDFLATLGTREKRTQVQTSIPQALALMNGALIAEATSPAGSATLAAVLDAPFLDDSGRIEALYLAALSRKPRPEEAARLLRYVERGGDRARALGDILWALLNSAEFMLNH